jgi:hypothetical protein
MALIRSGQDLSAAPFGMMKCPDCQAVISQKANSCPKCGRVVKPLGLTVLKVILWVMAISIAMGVIATILRAILE